MGDLIELNTDTWNSAATPLKAGSSTSHDIVNDVTTTINSLLDALNTVGFLNASKEFITAMEDFGHGMTAALACVGTDLAVVGSGLAAASAAFAATDAALGKTFAQLDAQLGYYTNTTASATLATPTVAANAALDTLTLPDASSSASSANWFNFSNTHLQPYPSAAPAAGTGVGIIGILLLLGLALA